MLLMFSDETYAKSLGLFIILFLKKYLPNISIIGLCRGEQTFTCFVTSGSKQPHHLCSEVRHGWYNLHHNRSRCLDKHLTLGTCRNMFCVTVEDHLTPSSLTQGGIQTQCQQDHPSSQNHPKIVLPSLKDKRALSWGPFKFWLNNHLIGMLQRKFKC